MSAAVKRLQKLEAELDRQIAELQVPSPRTHGTRTISRVMYAACPLEAS